MCAPLLRTYVVHVCCVSVCACMCVFVYVCVSVYVWCVLGSLFMSIMYGAFGVCLCVRFVCCSTDYAFVSMTVTTAG